MSAIPSGRDLRTVPIVSAALSGVMVRDVVFSGVQPPLHLTRGTPCWVYEAPSRASSSAPSTSFDTVRIRVPMPADQHLCADVSRTAVRCLWQDAYVGMRAIDLPLWPCSTSALVPAQPSPNEVMMGSYQNCWLLAAAQAQARQAPEALMQAMQDNGDGTVSCWFTRMRGQRDEVRVRKTLPYFESGPFAGQMVGAYVDAHGRSLWVAMLEKAYAAWSHKEDGLPDGAVARQLDPAIPVDSYASMRYGDTQVALQQLQGVAPTVLRFTRTADPYPWDRKADGTGGQTFGWLTALVQRHFMHGDAAAGSDMSRRDQRSLSKWTRYLYLRGAAINYALERRLDGNVAPEDERSFAPLAFLTRHLDRAGVGHGRVRDAIEAYAVETVGMNDEKHHRYSAHTRALFAQLRDAIAHKQPVTAAGRFMGFMDGGLWTLNRHGKRKTTSTTITPRHAVEVIGTTTDKITQQHSVLIRDPIGHGRKSDNPVQLIEFAKFMRHYRAVFLGQAQSGHHEPRFSE